MTGVTSLNKVIKDSNQVTEFLERAKGVLKLVKETADMKKSSENNVNTEDFARNDITPSSAPISQENGTASQPADLQMIMLMLSEMKNERATEREQTKKKSWKTIKKSWNPFKQLRLACIHQ